MPDYYEISPTHDTLILRNGNSSVSFGVHYTGDRRVEARVIVAPMGGAEDSWFAVESPYQRKMRPGQTQIFKVSVAVPPEASPGQYGLRLDVVSVANPDEEFSRGPQVSFEVAASSESKLENGFPWWQVLVVAVLLLFLVAGTVWWMIRDPTSERSGDAQPDRRGAFEVNLTWSGDFDRGRQVPRGAPRDESDFRFRRDGHDVALVPVGEAKLAQMGSERREFWPDLSEVKAALRDHPTDVIDEKDVQPSVWIAVRTSEGNYAAFTIQSRVSQSLGGTLSLWYALWENQENGR